MLKMSLMMKWVAETGESVSYLIIMVKMRRNNGVEYSFRAFRRRHTNDVETRTKEVNELG